MLLIFCLVTICVSVLNPALPWRWFVRSVLVYAGTYPSPAMPRKSIERNVPTISSVVKCLLSISNSPIFLWRASRSLSKSAVSDFAPNAALSFSTSSFFHLEIISGEISYFFAKSPFVDDSFRASKATLALNSGVNFLRVVFPFSM